MVKVSMRYFRSVEFRLRGFRISAEELKYLCKLLAAKYAPQRCKDTGRMDYAGWIRRRVRWTESAVRKHVRRFVVFVVRASLDGRG